MQHAYAIRRPRHASLALAIMLMVAVSSFFWRVAYRGDISRVFHVGEQHAISKALLQNGVYVYRGEYGYDGRWFLPLAVDPLLTQPSSVAALDDPVYRSRRILLPALAFVLSGGRPVAAEYVLVAINVLAFGALLWLIDALVGGSSAEQWGAVVGISATGAWIALLLGTTELLESALLVWALVSYRRSRFFRVAVALALAMLCRETSVLVFVAFVITAVVNKQRALFAHLAWAWLPAAAWNVVVWARLHSTGSVLGARNLDWPLVGLWHTLARQSSRMSLLNEAYWILSLGVLIGVAAAFVWHARDIVHADLPVALAGLGYVALFVCLGQSVLEYHIGFDRAFLPLFIFGGIGLYESRHTMAARSLVAAQAFATLLWLFHFGVKELRIT